MPEDMGAERDRVACWTKAKRANKYVCITNVLDG